jgi:hypothetical protein
VGEPRRSRLVWTAGAIAFVLIFPTILFGLYARHVVHSVFIQDLQRRSAAYGCIGDVHDPKRPRARAVAWVARQYSAQGRESSFPSLLQRLQEMAAYRALSWSTSPAEANRMYAALPFGRFDGFDAVAREYAGNDFCALDARRRQAVIDLYAVGGRAHIEAAMRGEPGA